MVVLIICDAELLTLISSWYKTSWCCGSESSFSLFLFLTGISYRGIVIFLQAFEQKVLSLKFYKSTIKIRQERHPKFKVLCCSSKMFDSKVSV